MEEITPAPEKISKLPKWATTVTPFSKTLALSMFIVFPIIGFFLGMLYQQKLTLDKEMTYASINDSGLMPTKMTESPKPMISKQVLIIPAYSLSQVSNWKKYKFPNSNISIMYPPDLYYKESDQVQGGSDISFFKVGAQANFSDGDIGGNEVAMAAYVNNDDRKLEELANKPSEAKLIKVESLLGLMEVYPSYNYYIFKPKEDAYIDIQGNPVYVDKIIKTIEYSKQ